MPEGKAVSQMFAGIAGRYDLANHLLSGGIDFYWRRILTRKVEAFAPKDVVDLATGSGDVAFKLRDRLGTEVPVTGLDFCEPMLDEAREKRQKNPLYRDLRFDFGDCMALPLEDNSIDAVTISFGVRNFEDRQKGLKEILRVLRPGGRLYVLEFSQPDRGFRPVYYFYLKYILPWVAAIATGDKSAYDYLAGTIENFPTKEALAEQLKLAGFETVDADGLTFSIVAIHEATKASPAVSGSRE
ncbi:bifunctional demethylmenaquinone methyltransferase/2-methoxy-6-polyprenyl-1,4-benzoquinol methylase UbiE [Coraliomargarita sinensis]|uniref:Demethylmenaquinone methyltransferase n=1 Tax=Coraliomargarita sinensis TaxID=2174842 RepID=A0A317ZKA4_9BACT|nr:bifunctional demethylmenaquinone methyltransferase/2-methoxy-6-polyprenyl-1,4-benzoquinol methylase UbiE [Coraliomargarita sinensis]PXA04663.1 bifunctional demethylmenaquinone methyltransferase/2-methoxy-6-polyprenyl-1,4-benzoquinol methylase UbiE [Coraliomargarita sinensis]